jgi:hypothetical protein
MSVHTTTDVEIAANVSLKPKADAADIRLVRSHGVTILAIFLSLVAAALYLGKQGRLLQMIIPLGCACVATLLIRVNSVAYIRLTLWSLLLAPLVRRLVDDRCGFTDHSLILATPVLLFAVALVGIWKSRANLFKPHILPMFLCLGALGYGLCISSILQPSAKLIYVAPQWATPIFFAIYLCCVPEKYELHRKAIASTFLIAGAVLGIYGLYQFYVIPPWDSYWLKNVMESHDATSFGRAASGQVRIWSTVNAPGPFANILVTVIVIWCFQKAAWKIPILLLALLDLSLTLIRTEWLDLALALALLLLSINYRKLHRYIISLVLLICCAPVAIYIPGVRDVVRDRISSFQNPKDDTSYLDRKDLLTKGIKIVLKNPLGTAHLAGASVDSGLLDLFLALGWPGGIAYLGGLSLILLNVSVYRRCNDLFLRSCHARAFGLTATFVSGSIFFEMPGAILWLCLGLYVAGCHHTMTADNNEAKLRRERLTRARSHMQMAS